MKLSFLIVTKNRTRDLKFTLDKLKGLIDLSVHEVLVLIDGCTITESIILEYTWVKWTALKRSVSASPARAILYNKAKGDIFIGLDDDAHPLGINFIEEVEKTFFLKNNLGIIAFQEIRGVFKSDEEAMQYAKHKEEYLTSDFVGCGFAIRKDVYNATRGFPVWINIYGEEPALALEILDLGYDILYKSTIMVNHRVDLEKRKLSGKNYFRFQQQLKNEIAIYSVYYKKPLIKILKLLFHNLKKYAIKDFRYFKAFINTLFISLSRIKIFFKYRSPVKKETINKKNKLKQLVY